jgi:hypothetical protein
VTAREQRQPAAVLTLTGAGIPAIAKVLVGPAPAHTDVLTVLGIYVDCYLVVATLGCALSRAWAAPYTSARRPAHLPPEARVFSFLRPFLSALCCLQSIASDDSCNLQVCASSYKMQVMGYGQIVLDVPSAIA